MSTEQEMPMYERDTQVIENHDHIDVDQIQMHNIDTYTHSNISHQCHNTNNHRIKRTQIELNPSFRK